ncbi:MAG: ribbon-helix-helix protein, CopG family [Rhodospirillales bacterium]|nr:ribbon-helix-helix protein, CopG family [Rhodospirillales bacterium]
MLTVRLDPILETRLEALARRAKRTKTHVVREAILRLLEDEEDRRVALTRLKRKGRRLGLAEVERRLGLED